MMAALTGLLFAIGGSLIASIVVKVTVTVTLALIGTWLASRSRAAVRHSLLMAAFGVLLLLPIASMVAPPVRIVVADRAVATPERSVDDMVQAPLAAGERSGRGRQAPPSSGISLSVLVMLLWVFGGAVSLLPMAMGWWRVRALRRSALPWLVGKPMVEALAIESGIERNVEVLLHEAAPGPMTCGVLHPAIVLPADAPEWAPDDLNRALTHELEHVKRADWVSHCLARLVCAIYWFHPLVWTAWRQLALEAERACDDAVLRRSEATAYADQLVDLARRLSMAARVPHLGMANRSGLSRRIAALLDGRQHRGPAGTPVVAIMIAFAAALVFAMSPVRMVAEPQTRDTAAALEFNAVSIKLVDTATGEGNSDEHSDPGRLRMGGNLHRFIIRAYGITDGQIGGEPQWFKTHLYAIEAVTSGPTTHSQKMWMLRAALADRFQLKLRQEDRDLPVYALEVAPGGPKFRELKPGEELDRDCDARPPGIYNQCFSSLETLTNVLNRVFGGPLAVDRPVVDHTNLTGKYNAHLRTVREKDDSGRTPSFPDLFHDLQSQMGLKLVPTKAKMPYYTVEHAVPPTPN